MKIRKTHAAWAVKLWVLASVFVIPFLAGWEVAAWLALGGVFALVWKVLPEEPEAPVEPLPYAHHYKDREIPRPEPSPRSSPKGEAESGSPPARG